MLLLATKIDLRSDAAILQRLTDRGLAPVATAQGQRLAKDIGAVFAEVNIFDHPHEAILPKLSQLRLSLSDPSLAQKPSSSSKISRNKKQKCIIS